MPVFPSGTVVFLFTDVEGSTQLWERFPDAMKVATARHDAILRQAIETHGGHVFKTVGDAFCAAFSTAPPAVSAALDAQRAFLQAPWGEVGPMRVRMALHVGATDERENDYFGRPVNRVARLLAAGHGGQILVSRAASELIRDSLAPTVSLRDLGEQRLKDVCRPEHVHQIVSTELPAEFPPLRTRDPHLTNLPIQPTTLIGRERDVASVEAMLGEPNRRLVTLTGTGGIGKTSLALEVAVEASDAFADGVVFVTLESLGEGSLVGSAIDQALELREIAGRSAWETLREHLSERHLLLVLDNFEHVLSAAPALATLLAACPRVTILVTSRAALQVRGEQEYLVAPLSVPDRTHDRSLAEVERSAAVQLFVNRARSVRADFALTSANAPAVAEICQRLDGIPLAIELAAALAKALPIDALAARLTDRLRLLTRGNRAGPVRQQTLLAAFDWSYNLLTAPEQILFRRLAAFAGGFPLEAVETMCAGDGVDESDALPLLIQLVEQSLVGLRERAGVTRYHLLEPLRQYAWQRLVEAGEVDAARDRHRDWCLALVARGEPEGVEGRAPAWVELMAPELDNVRAALAWCLERDPETGLRIANNMSNFWWHRGFDTEAAHWLEALLARATEPSPSRADVLLDGAVLAESHGDYQTATSRVEESLRIAREIGDAVRISGALASLGELAIHQGNLPRARELIEEGVEIARQFGDYPTLAALLADLGDVAWRLGDYVAAWALHEELIDISKKLGDHSWIAYGLAQQGAIAHSTGDTAGARALVERGVAGLREAGHRPGLGFTLASLGYVVGSTGDYTQAQVLLRESLSLLKELSHRSRFARSLCFLGVLAIHQEAFGRGARLVGAAEAVDSYYRATLDPGQRADLYASLATARGALGDDAFARAFAAGRSMTLEQAAGYALSDDQAARE